MPRTAGSSGDRPAEGPIATAGSAGPRRRIPRRSAQFADGVHRPAQIHGGDHDEPVGVLPDDVADLVVADERADRTVPGAEEADLDAGFVHAVEGPRDGGFGVRDGSLRTAAQGVQESWCPYSWQWRRDASEWWLW